MSAFEAAGGGERAINTDRRRQPEVSEDALVPDLVAHCAAVAPNALALADGKGTLSYAALDAGARRLGRRLADLGVGPDVLVGLALERSTGLAVGALGILKAGGAYVALDPGHPAERLRTLLEDACPPVVVTTGALAAHLPAGPWRVLSLEEAFAGPDESAPPTSRATAKSLAYVIFTSGSTGRPKGVEVTHGSLLNLILWHQRSFAVTRADRATQLASPAFDAAVWELWPYLTAGASIHVPDEATRTTPELLRDWLLAQGITISFAPTPVAERLMTLPWPASCVLRRLLIGGDTLHRHPRAGLPFVLVNNYGPTEATVVATSGPVPPAETCDVLPSIGRPIANTRVYIVDEALRPVPAGETGELCIAGRGVARGYLKHPELTAERFLPDPFADEPGARLFRTGDLARYLPDGQIAFLGRLDQQIKVRGHRIEPAEIIAALDAHPDVAASAVIAQDDEAGERRVVAYVVPAGQTLAAQALREHLTARLPQFMVPSVFVRLPVLPMTSNGKVDRAALPPPDTAIVLRDEPHRAPATEVEARLAPLVAELLGLDDVSVDDNFFLLGGHSLLGTQLIARVREAFDVDLRLRSIFDHPTVAALASEVEEAILTKLGATRDGPWEDAA
ncbi:MAG: non-ribosomal peptide synthetase [Candidatus Rokuibacteriota bacterium]